MHVKRVLSSLLAAAVLMGLMALPAVANPVPNDPANATGALDGEAKVGKIRAFCDHDGFSDVSGPGIGTPLNNGKNAYWSISATLTPTLKPFARGFLEACGRLEPMFSNRQFPSQQGGTKRGLGAACGASKGHAGKGSLRFPGKPAPNRIYLRNLGWKVSTGGAFTVTGEALTGQPKHKAAADGFVAKVEAVPDVTGGQGSCANKFGQGAGKTGGATGFDVVGTYTLVPGGNGLENARNLEMVDTNEDGEGDAIACKNSDNDLCAYGDKKDPEKT